VIHTTTDDVLATVVGAGRRLALLSPWLRAFIRKVPGLEAVEAQMLLTLSVPATLNGLHSWRGRTGRTSPLLILLLLRLWDAHHELRSRRGARLLLLLLLLRGGSPWIGIGVADPLVSTLLIAEVRQAALCDSSSLCLASKRMLLSTRRWEVRIVPRD
jgi:hypothetical protein